jgi:catechol 2,3-dioxygenase-like lactoylglutathione lyase family enzyme
VVKLSQTIPALPVRDAARAVEFYRDRLLSFFRWREDA